MNNDTQPHLVPDARLSDWPAYSMIDDPVEDLTDVINGAESPQHRPLRHRLVGNAKRDLTCVRQYTQFILHDIQSELSEGDTLVFVDYPTPSKPVDNVGCFFYAWNSVQFRMPSEKLLATGSAKFAEMLSPTYQFRVQRRRKMVNKLPPGVKFVLDLTPPSEGDELVFQMTEVSLTPGLINWWTAFDKHSVDDYVVSGHDDVCSCWKDKSSEQPNIITTMLADVSSSESRRDEEEENDPQMNRAITAAIQRSVYDVVPQIGMRNHRAHTTTTGLSTALLEKKSKGDFSAEPVPAYRKIPDYCPFRHRVNILRLCCMIANKQVSIDSAPRMWTLVAVAKILDCTSIVSDSVLQWIMSPNNTVFIEVLPEESLQLGVALKLEGVTRSAFRILVNELAIEEAAQPNGVPKAAAYTVFGRKRHDPGDDLNNLIQHAARAMVERISGVVKQLTSEAIFDEFRIFEWLRLQDLIALLSTYPDDTVCYSAKETARSLAMTLKNTWKNSVVKIMLKSHLDADRLVKIDDHRATYVDIRHFERFDLIYSQFNNVQKALCPFMYEHVTDKWGCIGYAFSQGTTASYLEGWARNLWAALGKVFLDHPEFKHDPAWSKILLMPPNDLDILSTSPRVAYTDLFSRARHAFDYASFEEPLRTFLRTFYNGPLRVDHEIPMNMARHLLLELHQNELKFLPLWAGGNDDGTGGVFEPALPPADYGPAGPGPGYCTGITIPSDSSSVAGSVSSVLRQLRLDRGSTVGPGSVDVQDGISTIYNPRKVVADDVSIRSESFTDGGSEYGNAKFAVPAAGQPIANAVAAVVFDETPDDSDADTSVNLDEVMTEVGPEDSRSREVTPEYVTVDSGLHAQASPRGGGGPATGSSAERARSSSLLDDDDDIVMI
ncbi:hypothetical protein CCHL11_01282 [Colletotrichum chlorophyti]|uniref:Uncharacterized protein n=1 Tax=Colletotrichum chlorophyti TaxID=708187 RepID=A0A1Q8S7A9_9PEZI|nr:hypothetical protein CCHL11_01282 [Colletotrichum chlorophyti]